jgi:large subunit ribosomal protein L10
MPGRGSVPPEKIARVDALAASLVAKPMVAVVGIRGVPASALQSMRRELRRRDHPITVATNSTIRHALEKAMHDRPAFGPLLDQVQEPTAVLSASGNPFSLYQEFLRTRSPTPARGGEVAPHDIFVPAGITNFKPGPIVGELQHAGFPAAIEKGKVILKKDTTIVKAGATISREVAGLLTRLEIFPLEVGLTLRAVVDGSTYYPPEVLSVDLEARRGELAREATRALGLAVALAFPTPQSLPRLLGRAHRRALGLALATQYLTKETIEPLFAQAMREAAAVGRLTGH